MVRIGLALAALAGFAATGLAGDVEVNAPYTTVRAGRGGVEVIAPFTYVRINRGVQVLAPYTDVQVDTKPAAPAPAQPKGELIPAPKTSAPTPVVAVSHYDFGYAFKPAPGNYMVDLIHPRTCCPVRVCFTLPCGCPRVKVRRDEVVFDYGRHEVEIEFRRDGRVVVEYN